MRTTQYRHSYALSLLAWCLLASLAWGQGIIGGGILGGGGDVALKLAPSAAYDADKGTWADAAIQFNASDVSHLAIDDATQSGLDFGTGDYSFAAWVYADTSTATQTVFSKYASDTGFRLDLTAAGEVTAYHGDGTEATGTSTTASMTDDTWYLLIGNADRDGDLTIWKGETDGTLTGILTLDISARTSTISNAADFLVGASAASTDNFDGRLDSLGLWSRLLTADERTAIINGGAGVVSGDLTTSEKTGLVSFYDFNGPVGGGWVDTWGTNHLTPQFAELVTNGTFTGDTTGWTLGANWAYDTNNVTATAADESLSQSTVVPTAGKLYSTSYVVSAITGGTCKLSLGGVNGTTRSTAATFAETVRATSATALSIDPVTTLSGTIDTVSVKAAEILPAGGIARGRAQDSNFAVSLDGSSDYYSYSGTAFNLGTSDAALGCAFRIDSLPDVYSYVMGGTTGGGDYCNVYITPTGKFYLEFQDGAGPLSDTSSAGIAVGQWNTLIVNIDRSGYISVITNGVSEDVLDISSRTASCDPGNLYIGRHPASATYYFHGLIDNAFYANRVLTPTEITYLHNDGEWRQYAEIAEDQPSLAADIVGMWEFDDSSAMGADSANSYTLTENGSPTQTQGINYTEGVVSYWEDQAGSLNAANNNLAQRPAFTSVVSGLNDHSALLFDGVDDYLDTGLDGQAVGTLVAVVTTSGTDDGIVGVEDTGNRSYLLSTTGPVIAGGVATHDESTVVSDEDPSSAYRIVILTYGGNGEAEALYVDGTEEYSGTQSGAVSTTEDYLIGAINSAGTPGTFGDVSVAQILIYNKVLSASERAALTARLQASYGLSP